MFFVRLKRPHCSREIFGYNRDTVHLANEPVDAV